MKNWINVNDRLLVGLILVRKRDEPDVRKWAIKMSYQCGITLPWNRGRK